MVGVKWIGYNFSRETLCSGVKQCAKGGLETLFESKLREVIDLSGISGPSYFCCFVVSYVAVKNGFVVLAVLDFLK